MHDAKMRDLLRQVVIYGCLGQYANFRVLKTCFHLFRNVSRMSFTVLNFLRFSFCGWTWEPEDH